VAVLLPAASLNKKDMEDSDMAGPIVFCLCLGICLLLRGKLHLGYIFGFSFSGSFGMYTVLNLMASGNEQLGMYHVFSVLGYCLLPIVMLSAFSIIITLNAMFGYVLSLLAVAWCTYTATRFFEVALAMQHQRYLIAYPVFLVYTCFALITIF